MRKYREVCDICRKRSKGLKTLPLRMDNSHQVSEGFVVCMECRKDLPPEFQNRLVRTETTHQDHLDAMAKPKNEVLAEALKLLGKMNIQLSKKRKKS